MFFKKKQQPVEEVHIEPTPEEYATALRANAIEYIVSLKKADKDRFIDAVQLIWEGYNKLNNVKTENERIMATERKKMGDDGVIDDDAMMGLLETEFVDPPVIPKGDA